jgi:hypothetical protein
MNEYRRGFRKTVIQGVVPSDDMLGAEARLLRIQHDMVVEAMRKPLLGPNEKTPLLSQHEDDEAIVRAVLDDEPTREITPCCQTCRVWGYSCCKTHGAQERASR